MNKLIIIYPSETDFKIDSNYKTEYNIASQIGIECIIFNFDKFKNESIFEVNKIIKDKTFTIYRGWMMTIDEYTKFYSECLKNNLILITHPIKYKEAHYFPYFYQYIKNYTLKIDYIRESKYINLTIDEQKNLFIDLIKCHENFIIKDFVKSNKTQNGVKVFSRNISKDDLYNEIQKFINDRKTFGNFYEGLVFKTYVSLKKYEDKTNEWRLWIYNNKIIDYSQNSNLKINQCKSPNIDKYIKIVKNIPIQFFTLDIAETTKNQWTILEAGDAQVSGPATGQNFYSLYNNLI